MRLTGQSDTASDHGNLGNWRAVCACEVRGGSVPWGGCDFRTSVADRLRIAGWALMHEGSAKARSCPSGPYIRGRALPPGRHHRGTARGNGASAGCAHDRRAQLDARTCERRRASTPGDQALRVTVGSQWRRLRPGWGAAKSRGRGVQEARRLRALRTACDTACLTAKVRPL